MSTFEPQIICTLKSVIAQAVISIHVSSNRSLSICEWDSTGSVHIDVRNYDVRGCDENLTLMT